MKISANLLELITTLRDAIQADGGTAFDIASELAQLPDLEGSRATAGYRVTPEGDIVSDHWWLVMDDDSILDASDGDPVRCSNKDPRHGHYFAFPGDGGIPVEVLTFADHLRAKNRGKDRVTFGEMMERHGSYVMPEPSVTPEDLRAIEAYADRLFAKVGLDIAFSRHFIDRVNDPRNEKPITPAELVRLFKQTYRKHGKRIPRLGPEAEAVLRDMATDVNVPFVLKLDRSGMLTLLSKTVMRKPDFGTGDEVFAVEDGKVVPSDAAQQAASLPGDLTVGGMEATPQDATDEQVRPEDMQLGWEDLIDRDVKEVDHPEFMPGGEEDSGHDPTYDERRTQYNPGHPAP